MTGLNDVGTLVKCLNLKPHPEGGFFKEIWTSNRQVEMISEPSITGSRTSGSTIYYMVLSGDFSHWHRHKAEEIFYWHAGGILKVHLIDDCGRLVTKLLGNTLKHRDVSYHVTVEPWTWMALEVGEDSDYVLMGDACFPGFEYTDWEMGKKGNLLKEFPQHREIIERLAME